jgi:uncharacterized protein YjbI with pentapeptide repeats
MHSRQLAEFTVSVFIYYTKSMVIHELYIQAQFHATMEYCQYGNKSVSSYHNYGTGWTEQYKCQNECLPGKSYCKFHDNEYAHSNPEEIISSFYKFIEETNNEGRIGRYVGFIFSLKVDLSNIVFKNDIYFSRSKFENEVDFSKAIFRGSANFSNISFKQNVKFIESVFDKQLNFELVTFEGTCDFSGSVFNKEINVTENSNEEQKTCDFSHTKFENEVDFSKTSFYGKSNFSSQFKGSVDFSDAEFNDESKVYFDHAIFHDEVKFIMTKFNNYVEFANAIFKDKAIALFNYATFKQRVSLIFVEFDQTANF